MAIIKGLSGDVDITAEGKLRSFSNYGVPGGTAAAFAATATLVNVLNDPTGPDSIEIVSCARGRAIARNDGGITLDLRDETATTDIAVVYNRTTGVTTEQVTATVVVADPYFPNGYPEGKFYRPEVDGASDDLVIEPGRTTRVILVKPVAEGGFDADAIVAAEPGLSSAPGDWGNWLRDNPATGGGGAHYGETDALALDYSIAKDFHKKLRTDFQSPWLLAKRGTAIPTGLYDSAVGWAASTTFESIGESALHPIFIGSYGTGPLPHFEGTGARIFRAANVVVSGISCEALNSVNSFNTNIVLDNILADFTGTDGDTTGAGPDGNDSGIIRHFAMRRIKGLDNFVKTATGSPWGTGDRVSFIHPSDTAHAIYEKMFSDQAGASRLYRADRDVNFPKAPENQSHAIYQSVAEWDATFMDILGTWPSGSFMQFRSGGVLVDAICLGANTGINPAIGPTDFDGDVGVAMNAGGYTMVHRYWQSAAGFKGAWTATGTPGVIAGGVSVQTENISLIDSGAINAGSPRIYTASTDIGPGYNPAATTLGVSSYFPIKTDNAPGANPIGRSNFVTSNWNRPNYPDENTQGVAVATRDAATIGAYADALLSASGSTLADLSDHLGTLDKPWEHARLIADYFGSVFGMESPAPVAGETLTFAPDTGGWTPGMRAELKVDWDKKYLPGDTTDNDVDLDGHSVSWNYTPKNGIRNLTFGAGGAIALRGGALRPSGTVTVDDAGNTLTLERGAKFDLPSHGGSGVLDVSAVDSRFLNAGTMTGNVDIAARYASEIVFWEGSAFTLASGRALTMYGHSHPGFDGTGGGGASLTLAGGSATRFLPGLRMSVDGMTSLKAAVGLSGATGRVFIKDLYMPRIGATVIGATSGATAVVSERLQNTVSSAYFMLDQVTGVFVDGEDLICGDTEYGPFPTGARPIGQVSGTPDYVLPAIEEYSTGLAGFDAMYQVPAPAVASTVTLGGTLHVDVTGVANGIHTLIDVDTVTGVFAAVTAAGNSAKDLTVTISATQVQVAVADGSGGISGGTS